MAPKAEKMAQNNQKLAKAAKNGKKKPGRKWTKNGQKWTVPKGSEMTKNGHKWQKRQKPPNGKPPKTAKCGQNG